MKKIIFTLLLICTFAFAKAESFKQGEYIPVYIRKDGIDYHKYLQSRFLISKSDNQYVYCIEPTISFNKNIEYYDIEEINSLSTDALKRASLISYFGYNYKNHLENYWYSITQVMIQRVLNPNLDIYFTNKLNGKRNDSLYQKEINEINSLVDNYLITPSFSGQAFNVVLGESLHITDNNKVLANYKINSAINYNINDNTLIINPDKVGSHTIEFTKDNIKKSVIYKSNDSQNILAPGSIDIKSTINLNVLTGSITINKLDENTKTCNNDLPGTIYTLYDNEMNQINTLVVDSNCKAKIDNLKAGNYYLKETKSNAKYLIDESIYNIKIDKNNLNENFNLYNKLLTNTIKITKFYGNDSFKKEDNALFNLYDENQTLIESYTTDSKGEIYLNLTYGKYKLKQVSGKNNYYLSEDIIIEVNENTSIYQELNIYNKEITGKLIINKIDSTTNSNILDNPAYFKLFDSNNNFIKEFKLDDCGYYEINNLSIGNYYLVETLSPIGYQKNNNKILFEINEDNLNINLNILNDPEEIETGDVGIKNYKELNPDTNKKNYKKYLLLSIVTSILLFIIIKKENINFL